ncbi:hypothetical protein Syun_001643 [Stephania yunnanensis]|uniref:Uncharacterized protein n=1 Tax=Stephania yunnanensis TaxID=152371 RepID=A0AAP0LF74_9MAGN
MVRSLLGGRGGAQLVTEEPSLSRRSPTLQSKMGVWPWARLIRFCLLHNCIMSNQGENAYNLREKADREDQNWCAQIEQRMTVMAETCQKAIHDMRSAEDQRLADMA